MVYFISVRGLSSTYEPSSNITQYYIKFQLWLLTTGIKMRKEIKEKLQRTTETACGMVDRERNILKSSCNKYIRRMSDCHASPL